MRQLTASEASNDEVERQRHRLEGAEAWHKLITPKKNAVIEQWWAAAKAEAALKSKQGEV